MSTQPPPPTTAPPPALAPRAPSSGAGSSQRATAPAPAVPTVPRSGEIRDRGVARRESVHALRWSTDGAVKVLGEVDVGEATLSGPTAIGGPLSAVSLRSSGTLELGASVDILNVWESSGSVRARGPVHAGDAELRGAAHLLGELNVARRLTVRGSLVASSVRAQSFVADGAVQVGGDVSAQRVDLRFRQRSHIGSVHAAAVRLTVRPPNPVEMVLGRHLPVEVLRIEADSVELEGVDVRFVRSPEIVLGRNAHVTEFEGRIVRRHPSARVGPESRSPPPHGLTR